MSQSAQVDSIDRLKRFREALARFVVDAQAALATAELEVRRVVDKLEQLRKHWQQQVNKRQEAVNEARAALMHARALHEGKSVGCAEQELALKKARERLKEAEDKVVAVRRWQRDLPTYLKDLETPARSLAGFLDADLRTAVVQLDGKIAALEAYMAIAAPQGKETS